MSTVPGVKARLVTLFTAAFPTATVIYGPKGNLTFTEGGVVEIGGVRGTVETPSLGLREDADYVVEVIVSVTIPSGTQQQATEAADAMWATAKTILRTPPGGSLGVPGVTSLQPTGEFELIETASPDGPNAGVRFGVHVQALS